MNDHPDIQLATQWPLTSTLVFGALPSAVGCGRLHARNVVCEWGLGAVAETVKLIVSELMTNAVRAATGPDGLPRYEDGLSGLPVVHLRLSSDRRRVLIEVWDRSDGTPISKDPEPDEEGGRGLVLVEALSRRWSWQRVAGWPGKVVWAEIGS